MAKRNELWAGGAALAVSALVAASWVAAPSSFFVWSGEERGALAGAAPAPGYAPALRRRARDAKSAQAPLPPIRFVAEADAPPDGAALAIADADGGRHRLIRFKANGAAIEGDLPGGMSIPLDRVLPLLEAAFSAELASESNASADVRANGGWPSFWRSKSGRFPEWIAKARSSAAPVRVPVAEVLASLAEIRSVFRAWDGLRARLRAEDSVDGGLRHFGSTLVARSPPPRAGASGRSVARRPLVAPRASDPERIGAFAGWLVGDKPVLFTGGVADRDAVRRWAAEIGAAAARPKAMPARGCIEARIGSERGLRFVREVTTGLAPEDGELLGLFQARAADGTTREFLARGDVELRSDERGIRYLAVALTLDEYVARVVDAAGASTLEAAKAMAVLARSETALMPHDRRGCRIARYDGPDRPFSLSPSSEPARAIVAWTDEVGLSLPSPARERVFAKGAVAFAPLAARLAEGGLFYDEILASLGSGARIAPMPARKAPGRPAPGRGAGQYSASPRAIRD